MYKYSDSIENAEEEFENFSYSWCIHNGDGEIVAIAATETEAERIVEALNKNA